MPLKRYKKALAEKRSPDSRTKSTAMISLQSSEGLLQLFPQLPKGWKGKRLPGSTAFSYQGKLGTLVLQLLEQKEFSLQYVYLDALRPFSFFPRLQKGWQSLLSLKGKFPVTLHEEKHNLVDGQFIFFHGEETDELHVQVPAPSHVQLWSTCYAPPLYERWLSLFPKLKRQEPFSPLLLTPPMPARTGVIEAIRSQFYEEYAPNLQVPYLQLKTEEQFFGMAAQSHDPALGEKATPWERMKAHQAQEIIMKDIRIHHTNEELADMIEIDRGALNRAFRLEYGLGMKQYLTRERMEKSKEYLLEGKSIKKVAELVGYKHSATYSYEFRKYYYYSPVDFQNGHM